MIGGQNATLNFDNGLTNQGAVAFSNGVNNISGAVTNTAGGNITITGGASVTFWNDVAQNGTLVVSTVGSTHSSAVFLGALAVAAASRAVATFLLRATFVLATPWKSRSAATLIWATRPTR